MTSKVDNGGPAFPKPYDPYPNVQGEKYDESPPGMSLRDWFAGQALISAGTWTPGPGVPSLNCQDALDRRAEWAYASADAMLAERRKRGSV